MTGDQNIFIEWLPYRLVLRPVTKPAGGSWQQLDAYERHLRSLNLADPTRASEFRVAAEHVRDVATSNKTTDIEGLDERVASGELSAQDALKMLGKRPDPEDARKHERKRQDDADTLTRQLLHKAVIAIHAYGDKWLEAALKPLAAEAIAKRDQGSWNRVHDFAAWLRDPVVNICALDAVMADNVHDADPWLYAVGDAGRGVYLWQVEHSDPGQLVPGTSIPLPGGGWRIAYSLKRTANLPTVDVIADNAEAWGGAGLFSAAEVMANQARVLAEQDREIDALIGPEPTSGRKQRAVMID